MTKEYLLYNTVTHETIKLCDDNEGACIAALQEKGYYMLTEEKYGDKYQYPAIYKSPGIVWDQSKENKTNGDWTMTSREIEAGDDGSEHSHASEHSQGGLAKGLNYILYNSQTHESHSIPNELSDSGWILLNENAYPDYKHPAVYNTTTHTALDQSPESKTSDNWMIISKYKSTFTSSAQSIKDLNFGDSIASFRLSEPISINQKDVSMCIVGTKGKDKIIGSDSSELIMGGKGRNVYEGGTSADGFMFDSTIDFGKKVADKISDFNKEEGDKILLDKEMFTLGKKIKFKAVSGADQVRKASRTNKQFVYEESKGKLFFNENGDAKGWGDGGYFAKLIGLPELSANTFMLV